MIFRELVFLRRFEGCLQILQNTEVSSGWLPQAAVPAYAVQDGWFFVAADLAKRSENYLTLPKPLAVLHVCCGAALPPWAQTSSLRLTGHRVGARGTQPGTEAWDSIRPGFTPRCMMVVLFCCKLAHCSLVALAIG